MPIKKSAIKDLRKSRKKSSVNKNIKTHVKFLFSQTIGLIKQGKKSEAYDSQKTFQQAIDKAVKVRVFANNTAARKKTALAKAFKVLK